MLLAKMFVSCIRKLEVTLARLMCTFEGVRVVSPLLLKRHIVLEDFFAARVVTVQTKIGERELVNPFQVFLCVLLGVETLEVSSARHHEAENVAQVIIALMFSQKLSATEYLLTIGIVATIFDVCWRRGGFGYAGVTDRVCKGLAPCRWRSRSVVSHGLFANLMLLETVTLGHPLNRSVICVLI
jgi:hypothetical protein